MREDRVSRGNSLGFLFKTENPAPPVRLEVRQGHVLSRTPFYGCCLRGIAKLQTRPAFPFSPPFRLLCEALTEAQRRVEGTALSATQTHSLVFLSFSLPNPTGQINCTFAYSRRSQKPAWTAGRGAPTTSGDALSPFREPRCGATISLALWGGNSRSGSRYPVGQVQPGVSFSVKTHLPVAAWSSDPSLQRATLGANSLRIHRASPKAADEGPAECGGDEGGEPSAQTRVTGSTSTWGQAQTQGCGGEGAAA